MFVWPPAYRGPAAWTRPRAPAGINPPVGVRHRQSTSLGESRWEVLNLTQMDTPYTRYAESSVKPTSARTFCSDAVNGLKPSAY